MKVYAQASAALTASLIDDPFYQAISDDFASNEVERRQALSRYFEYSLAEAARTGRGVVTSNPALGGAAWLLPRTAAIDAAESKAKSEYLRLIFGPRRVKNYDQIVGFMEPLAAQVIPEDAWYLSIVGILPSAQGRGLGAPLLQETLTEASQCHAACYLETFTPRNVPFYERLGSSSRAQRADYGRKLCDHAAGRVEAVAMMEKLEDC